MSSGLVAFTLSKAAFVREDALASPNNVMKMRRFEKTNQCPYSILPLQLPEELGMLLNFEFTAWDYQAHYGEQC